MKRIIKNKSPRRLCFLETLIHNKKGNALISAMIAFSVLLVIAVSTVSLSLSKRNDQVHSIREHNNAYYVAEAAVQKGLQHLKNQIGKYYNEMQAVAQYAHRLPDVITTYLAKNYNGFFDNIKTDGAN